MFRLKSLPNNSTPESLTNPPDTAVPVSALTAAYPLHLESSSATFLAAQPNRFTHMVTAGAVFHSPQHQSLNNSKEDHFQVSSPTHALNGSQSSMENAHQKRTQPEPKHSLNPTPAQQGPHLLLVQRAASDTYPLHWELPGGMVDPTDKTLFETIRREVGEETGLLVKEIKGQVLPAEVFNTGWHRRMKKWIKVTFLVEVDCSSTNSVVDGRELALRAQDSAGAEKGMRIVVAPAKENVHDDTIGEDANGHGAGGDDASTITVTDNETAESEVDEAAELVSNISLARIAELENTAIPSAPPPIKLNPSEHQAYLWVTEAEVRDRKVMGMEMLFVCDEQVQALLGAFALHGKIYQTGSKE